MRSTKLLAALLAAFLAEAALAQEGGTPPPPAGGQQGGREGGREGRGDGRRRGRRSERDPATVQLTQLTYQRLEFETKNATSGKATAGVYLPADYAEPANAERKYPLVVWLHGMNEDDRDFHFSGAKVVDETIAAGKLARCIVVAFAAPSRTLYMNGEQEGNLCDLITKDLPAWATAQWRVSPERADHALMGVSLGGMAVLRYGLSSPELYGTVAAHSAATFPEDPSSLPAQHMGTVQRFGERLGWNALLGNPIDPAKFAKVNPTSLAKASTDVKGLRIYFDAGTNDRYGFGPANEKLSAALKAKGIAHTFRLIDGGEHSWGGGTVQAALVESLAFVNGGFSKACAANVAKPAGAPAGAPAGEAKKGESKSGQ